MLYLYSDPAQVTKYGDCRNLGEESVHELFILFGVGNMVAAMVIP